MVRLERLDAPAQAPQFFFEFEHARRERSGTLRFARLRGRHGWNRNHKGG